MNMKVVRVHHIVVRAEVVIEARVDSTVEVEAEIKIESTEGMFINRKMIKQMPGEEIQKEEEQKQVKIEMMKKKKINLIKNWM